LIIDAHTHIFPDLVAKRALRTVISNINGRLHAHTDGTLDGLASSMDSAGVDCSIVLPVATNPGQGNGILDWIREVMPHSPRLLFFGSVHPDDSGYRDLIRQMSEFGLQGLKFHPGYQGFPVDSKTAYPMYEEASKRDLALYFHSGYDPSLPDCDYTSVERFAAFLKEFRGAKIILAHGGGYGEWGRVLDCLNGYQCYFDLAFVLESMKENQDALALYRQNEDYFIFGTDSPWRDQKTYVDLIRNSSTLTEVQKEKLFSGNIRKLIRIDFQSIER